MVLDRLSPAERVAFVLHDSFDVEFATVAAVLRTTPAAARKLASRARARVRASGRDDGRDDDTGTDTGGGLVADADVVDAFMAAAREGDLARLLHLLAPGATVTADPAAVLAGTPERISGRREVAAFFDGSAHAALAVVVDGRAGAAWWHRGRARVLFDFTVVEGRVEGVVFRSAPDVLARVARRPDTRGPRRPVTPGVPASSHGQDHPDERTPP